MAKVLQNIAQPMTKGHYRENRNSDTAIKRCTKSPLRSYKCLLPSYGVIIFGERGGALFLNPFKSRIDHGFFDSGDHRILAPFLRTESYVQCFRLGPQEGPTRFFAYVLKYQFGSLFIGIRIIYDDNNIWENLFGGYLQRKRR